MLSFFRTKSSDRTVDKIIDGTKDMSLKVDEVPIDAANMQSSAVHPDAANLIESLGYQSETELKETIYGVWFWFIVEICLKCSFISVFRYIAHNSWPGKTTNARRS